MYYTKINLVSLFKIREKCYYIEKENNLLHLEMKSLIVNWIDGNKTYDFKLILCGSQDGFSRAVFKEKCYDIEQIVVIMRLKETKELVGGYNPLCWNIKEKSPDESYYMKLTKALFSRLTKIKLIIQY